MCIFLRGVNSYFRQAEAWVVRFVMKKFSFIFCLVAVASLGLSCSQSPANTEVANTAVVEVPTGFADANAALAEGTRLLDENQTDAAIAAFKQAIEMNPELAEAHFKLGVAYGVQEMQLERAGEAVPLVTTGEGKNKTSKLRSELAFEKAVDAYKSWLKTNPKDDAARFYLGRTYSKLLKDEEAEKEFDEAVKLKPEETEYQTELGAVLIKLAKYREAIAPLKKAIELDASNDRAIALLEDAEAGRQRVDYVSKDTNTNKAASNKASNSNSNSNTSSTNSNSAPPPVNAKLPPPPKPVTTPTKPVTPPGAQKEVPRNRLANPPVRRPNQQN